MAVSCENGNERRKLPVAVATASKAWVCDRLPAEIVGSNRIGEMDVSLL